MVVDGTAGMVVESDDERLKSFVFSLFLDAGKQQKVSAMHPIKGADGCHRGSRRLLIVDFFCHHYYLNASINSVPGATR